MILRHLWQLFLFPGLAFAGTLGLVAGWIDRKVSARVQFRVGPPFFQNFNDLAKLLGKETRLVRGGLVPLFIAAPIAATAAIALVATIVGNALFFGEGAGGDLIVVIYVLMLYSTALVLGAASTGNVFASLGAGRELKLFLADELAFLLVCLVPVVQAGYRLGLTDILAFQAENGPIIGSVSGALAFAIGLLAIQAKLALPPFHIPDAETELAGGSLIEYGGPLLAFWKLAHAMMYAVFPLLLILLFWGGIPPTWGGLAAGALKYVLILAVMIVVKNTNPRLRTDTVIAFFWKWAAPAAFFAVVLAALGA